MENIRPTSANTYGSRVMFSDFRNNLGIHPVTGNMTRIINSDSIKQAIRNLVLTNHGERIYKPLFGGDINKLLFENISSEADIFIIQDRIRKSIQMYEQRVEVLDIQVITTLNKDRYIFDNELVDNNLNENTLVINIFFRIIDTEEQLNVNILVERNR